MKHSGTNLRSLYVDRLHFLSPKLDDSSKNDVSVRSTDYARTIESVQHLLDGLYPREVRQTEGLEVRVRPLEDENMHPDPSCASLNAATKQFRQTVQQTLGPETNALLRKFKHLGADETKNPLRQIHRLYDLSSCMQAHGLGLPKDVSPEDVERMEHITTNQWWMIYDSSESLATLAIGRMLKDVKEQIMTSVENRQGKVKLGLFSGHDSTIAPVLSALDAFGGKYPGFAAMIQFELFTLTAPPSLTSRLIRPFQQPQHYIRMLYNGKPITLPACSKKGDHLDGNPSMCTLQAFMKKVDSMVPKDYEGMCRSEERVESEWKD
ncbi:hypothetical protein HK097_006764 [Rhizophlyctis rosea]|uniref:Acid phosphatase n=1 Tax=Rhizophlyctis rosea TaxID=64517 RepID=A0AAD5SDX1_9FUNG|nr:hypothetical protein HK097_006764 [Rhizophlyctis rosea]